MSVKQATCLTSKRQTHEFHAVRDQQLFKKNRIGALSFIKRMRSKILQSKLIFTKTGKGSGKKKKTEQGQRHHASWPKENN
jgi:hypothetical protein